MLASLAIGLAVLFAVGVVGLRRWREARAEAQRAGASLRNAIPVQRFDQIDRICGRRLCRCGEKLALKGEDSRQMEGRRYRVIVLECRECEREQRIYFDVTRVFN